MHVSVHWRSCMFVIIDVQSSTKVTPFALIPDKNGNEIRLYKIGQGKQANRSRCAGCLYSPKTSLTCVVRIISATALVNPELTGPDTKLIRKPMPSAPIAISMTPVKNDNSTARCHTPPAAWNVSNEAIAVGPMGTSLLEPSMMYEKHPRNEPYRPNWREAKQRKPIDKLSEQSKMNNFSHLQLEQGRQSLNRQELVEWQSIRQWCQRPNLRLHRQPNIWN